MSPAAPAPPPEVVVAVELYRLAPEDFTAARNARARQARSAGDRALATVVTGMRRPSVAAWALNLLVRERPDDVEDLLATGARLRAAQAAMDGPALRELARRQHEQMAGLRAGADALAAAAGRRLTDPVRTALDGTLRAAMADPGAEAAVRTGLLTTELVSTGFDPVEVGDAVAVPGAPPLLVPRDGAPPTERPAHPAADDDARVTLGRRAATRRTPAPRTAGTTQVEAATKAGSAQRERAQVEKAEGGQAQVDKAQLEKAQREAAERAEQRRARERVAAEHELALAEERSAQAAAARDAADAVVDHLARRHDELADEVERLTARLAEARAEEGDAARDHRAAQADRDAAADAAELATRAVREARARLEESG